MANALFEYQWKPKVDKYGKPSTKEFELLIKLFFSTEPNSIQTSLIKWDDGSEVTPKQQNSKPVYIEENASWVYALKATRADKAGFTISVQLRDVTPVLEYTSTDPTGKEQAVSMLFQYKGNAGEAARYIALYPPRLGFAVNQVYVENFWDNCTTIEEKVQWTLDEIHFTLNSEANVLDDGSDTDWHGEMNWVWHSENGTESYRRIHEGQEERTQLEEKWARLISEKLCFNVYQANSVVYGTGMEEKEFFATFSNTSQEWVFPLATECVQLTSCVVLSLGYNEVYDNYPQYPGIGQTKASVELGNTLYNPGNDAACGKFDFEPAVESVDLYDYSSMDFGPGDFFVFNGSAGGTSYSDTSRGTPHVAAVLRTLKAGQKTIRVQMMDTGAVLEYPYGYTDKKLTDTGQFLEGKSFEGIGDHHWIRTVRCAKDPPVRGFFVFPKGTDKNGTPRIQRIKDSLPKLRKSRNLGFARLVLFDVKDPNKVYFASPFVPMYTSDASFSIARYAYSLRNLSFKSEIGATWSIYTPCTADMTRIMLKDRNADIASLYSLYASDVKNFHYIRDVECRTDGSVWSPKQQRYAPDKTRPIDQCWGDLVSNVSISNLPYFNVPGNTAAGFSVLSTSFAHKGKIPSKHSRSAKNGNKSPHLMWANAPANTESFAIICKDTTTGSGPNGFTHWVCYNIPKEARKISMGRPQQISIQITNNAKDGTATQGMNDFGAVGYDGPEPPSGGGEHKYHFTVYALDSDLKLKGKLSKAEVLSALETHILAQNEIIGHFSA